MTNIKSWDADLPMNVHNVVVMELLPSHVCTAFHDCEKTPSLCNISKLTLQTSRTTNMHILKEKTCR